MILSLPNYEARENLIRALKIHIIVDSLFYCQDVNLNLQQQNNCILKQLLKITNISHFAAQIVKQVKEGIPIDISFIRIQPRLIQDARNWRQSIFSKIYNFYISINGEKCYRNLGIYFI